jgi:hypothetical protein
VTCFSVDRCSAGVQIYVTWNCFYLILGPSILPRNHINATNIDNDPSVRKRYPFFPYLIWLFVASTFKQPGASCWIPQQCCGFIFAGGTSPLLLLKINIILSYPNCSPSPLIAFIPNDILIFNKIHHSTPLFPPIESQLHHIWAN